MAGERDVEPLVRVTNPAIVVEAVKLAEDRSGDVIVRLYESLGGRASGELLAGFEHTGAVATDLLERSLDRGAMGAILDLRPFEIRTVRLVR